MGLRGPQRNPGRPDKLYKDESPTPLSLVEKPREPVPAPQLALFEVDESNPQSRNTIGQDIYNSIAESVQAEFYEPSDWQYARLTCMLIDGMMNQKRVSSHMVASISGMLNNLLLTEQDRRKLKILVKQAEENPEPQPKVDVGQIVRERLKVV